LQFHPKQKDNSEGIHSTQGFRHIDQELEGLLLSPGSDSQVESRLTVASREASNHEEMPGRDSLKKCWAITSRMRVMWTSKKKLLHGSRLDPENKASGAAMEKISPLIACQEGIRERKRGSNRASRAQIPARGVKTKNGVGRRREGAASREGAMGSQKQGA